MEEESKATAQDEGERKKEKEDGPVASRVN
jgi:hypothetical protein